MEHFTGSRFHVFVQGPDTDVDADWAACETRITYFTAFPEPDFAPLALTIRKRSWLCLDYRGF